MKNLTLLIACLIWAMSAFGQDLPVAYGEIQSKTETHRGELLLFDFNTDVYKQASQKSPQLQLRLPFFKDSEILLDLHRIDIYTNDFSVKLKTQNGVQKTVVEKGQHYTGIIENDPNSSVSLSIFSGEIAGIIYYKGHNYDIGPLRAERKKHFISKSNQALAKEYIKCNTEYDPSQLKEKTKSQKSNMNCTNATEIYFECDYDMFLNFGSDTATANYVSGLFAQVSTIFSNESIPLLISEIVVWVEDDPYTDNADGITDFANELNANGFNGHLAHLLTNDQGANGGIAFVDVLCGNNPYAYSDINNLHDPYPTYSWDVQVVTHELGHNFGSPHTHDCAWGVDGNEQIDDCGSLAQGSGGPCYDSSNPIIPSVGGTIMSYCHLNGVGINFSEGFGTEPGDLIRANHAACLCDNATCESANELVQDGTFNVEPSTGNGASSPNAMHADWFYYTPSENGTISIASCGENEDTRLWIHTGTCENLVFETISDDDCDMGNGTDYASEIIDFQVTAGTMYFIEWDDRWSQGSFDMTFSFLAAPQVPECDADSLMVSGTIIDSTLHAGTKMEVEAVLQGSANSFKAGSEIDFSPGFEILPGTELSVEIEVCQNNN